MVFIIVRYLIWIRRWVTETKLGLKGKLTARHKSSRTNGTSDGMKMASIPKSSVRAAEDG